MSLRSRVQTHLRRHQLDAELAAGADPNGGGLLGERAHELVAEGSRRVLAAGIERVQSAADSRTIGLTAQVPIAKAAIRDSRLKLSTIVDRLESPGFVSPQGVAMVSALLSDGESPIYLDEEGGENPARLDRRLEAALHALEHGPVLTG